MQAEAPVVRSAQSVDEPAVRRIVEAAYAPYVEVLGRRPSPMDADHGRLVAQGRVEVLVEGGEVIGLIVLVEEPEAILIENVAVDPSRHGRGYGRLLLDHAEGRAIATERPSIRLYTNEIMTRNIAIYRQFGFAETHREANAGFHRVFMRKWLGEPSS